MNIQQKVEKAKKAVDFIATHDDESVEVVQDAIEEVGRYAFQAYKDVQVRRLGNAWERFKAYWARLGKALIGRA